MQYIKICSMPKIRFAHTYTSPTYENFLPKMKNSIEISYLAEGTMFCKVGDQTYTKKQYNISCNIYQEETSVHSNCFHEHHTVSFVLDYEVCNVMKENAIALSKIIPVADHVYAHDLIDEIIRIYTIYPDRNYTINGLFLQLLDEVNRLSRNETMKVNDNSSIYTRKAKEYIYQNLHRPIQQKEIAEYLNITPEYLCNVFKKENNVSLMTFINQIKLFKIHSVMKQEHLKLFEAAELYGYNNPNYVSRLYKKYFGCNITKH